MDIAHLGFDSWFRAQADMLGRDDCTPARVSRVDRDRLLVLDGDGEMRAELTGRLAFAAEAAEDMPGVGDWVLVQKHNEGTLAIVHALVPRRTVLRRKSAGDAVDVQLIAANVDVAFVVQSCDDNFNVRRMERYAVVAADGGIEPVIVLNKSDLLTPEEREARIAAIRDARIDARIVLTRALEAGGAAELELLLEQGRTYCLLGSSGVGKTTLLNHLLGQEHGRTMPVREKDDRGRHTTTNRELLALPGGALLIDTPGMRELGLLGMGEGIDAVFDDIHALASTCRFADCAHTEEAGCAVLAALAAGTLAEERYASFLKLAKESAFHEMSYYERRRKDKAFGRMVKSVLENHDKRRLPPV